MAVFLRHRFAGGVKTTIWKKYSVAYSGTVSNVMLSNSRYESETANVWIFDGYSFAADGTATLMGSTNLAVSYSNYTVANQCQKAVFEDVNYLYYYGDDSPATRKKSGMYGRVYKTATRITDPRAQAIAGDYIEDVESEDPNAYPDNGPLGLYFYIKQ